MIELAEWTDDELESRMKQSDERPFAVYIYSPLCGTCRAAERMLQVIASMHPDMALIKLNANTAARRLQQWRVESVPCLLLIADSTVTSRRYRMESVDSLYDYLKPVIGYPSA